jgi:hypothetical protein
VFIRIPFIIWRDMQLIFCRPFDCLAHDPFDVVA